MAERGYANNIFLTAISVPQENLRKRNLTKKYFSQFSAIIDIWSYVVSITKFGSSFFLLIDMLSRCARRRSQS